MGILDTIVASDAAFAVDSDLTPGVESATLKQTGASPRTISVNVSREEQESVPGLSNQLLPSITVFIVRHAVKGATSINVGVDVLSLPTQRGGTQVDQVITQIINEDAGGFLVKLS